MVFGTLIRFKIIDLESTLIQTLKLENFDQD